MKRNKRAEKKRWAEWTRIFFSRTVEEIRGLYDGR